MNPQSPSLLTKTLSATLGFALLVAVPLLTAHYAAQAHAGTEQDPAFATARCSAACAPQH